MPAEPKSVDDIKQTLLDGLSDEAAAIVRSPLERLLVVAGAGAGKTEAMARRIAWWHAIDGVPKDKIVAFTFTERAAEEMKFRVRRYMAKVSPEGEDPSLGGMYVGTIHSYCMNMLRRLWPREFHNDEILDDVGRYALIQQGFHYVLGLPKLQAALGVGKTFPPSRGDVIEYFLRGYDLLNEYNRLDVQLSTSRPPRFGQESDWCKQAALVQSVGDDEVADAFSEAAARYYAYLRCRHFLDFSTSQSELVRRLSASPERLAEVRSETTHLVVDEVQDVNVVQDELRRLLVGDAGRLTAVGDHRQAIYGFRGGRIDLMADLAAELRSDSSGGILELTANYRSTPRIIELSNAWNDTIAAPTSMGSPAMKHGRASRVDADATHLTAAQFGDRVDEANWIAQSVKTLVSGGEGAVHDERGGARGITYSDVAVLVRTSADARSYQQALIQSGIPAVVRAGPDLFAQPEVLLFASALAISADRPEFMGGGWNKRAMVNRLAEELGTGPSASDAIAAAYLRLEAEGLPVRKEATERLVRAARAIARRMYGDGVLDDATVKEISTPELRQFLRQPGELRRVFPQTLFQWLLAEGDVAAWDTESPRGRQAMFHLGQLSSLVTGIETPGWTNPASYKHQVTSLILWASKNASPEEAPLLVAPDAVTVSTIHSTKGLEYAAVFLADVAAYRFPSSMAKRATELPFGPLISAQLRTDLLADNANNDSERRLMYVALTRAERYLFISTSKPSKFFKEVEKLTKGVGGTVAAVPAELPVVTRQASEISNETRLVTSFSALRYFLECPHDFYFRKVLGFTPTIDQAFGYGRGVHNLMRDVHTSPGEWAALANDRGALEAKLQELIDEGLFYLRHTTGAPAELMQKKGIRIVADYVATYSDELAELTFEPEREFELLLPEENVLITGAIDVIRKDNPPSVTIIDFKSGEAESDKHQSLDHDEMRMQVSIYAIAAKQELQYEPDQGLVRYLGERDDEKRELPVPLDSAVIERSRQQVADLAANIQGRHFRATPTKRGDGDPKERCRSCDFMRLCAISLAT